jgi:hypothetical protein
MTKFVQPGREHHRGGHRRDRQTHAPRRLLASFDDLLEDRFHLAQRLPETTDALFASIG